MGSRLHRLFVELPEHDAITDTLDNLLGALHGLARAVEEGFVDRPGAFESAYRAFLAHYALNVGLDRPRRELWLAGFYFNSSLHRLAAAYDRITKMLGAPYNRNAHN